MAIETGRQTINDTSLIEVDSDPLLTGIPANVDIGDLLFLPFERGVWQRVGGGPNDLARLDAFSSFADIQETANATKTLFSYSKQTHIFTGTTAGQIVNLPDATTLLLATEYKIWNLSTQPITIRNVSGTVLAKISPQSRINIILSDNTTSNGTWSNNSGNRSFGVEYAYSESLGELTNNSSSTYVTRVSLSIVNASPEFTYALFWNSKWRASNANRGVDFQLLLDGATELFQTIYFSSSTSEYPYQGGSYRVSGLTAGNHTIDLRFRVGIGPTTITTSQSRLTFWRST
jgi:hypothetical protein